MPSITGRPLQAAQATSMPEQIKQATMALEQASSASAGSRLKPDDIQMLIWSPVGTLVDILKASSPVLQLAWPVQAALAMATPEQIQQAMMALAQAASASAGGQLKPDDLQALFGPQWATLVAMPGGAISLPPDQLQQFAGLEGPQAFTQMVRSKPVLLKVAAKPAVLFIPLFLFMPQSDLWTEGAEGAPHRG